MEQYATVIKLADAQTRTAVLMRRALREPAARSGLLRALESVEQLGGSAHQSALLDRSLRPFATLHVLANSGQVVFREDAPAYSIPLRREDTARFPGEKCWDWYAELDTRG